MSSHRIKFSKSGALIFVSHLDFAHSFTRALKRAELPLKYSEGFSPHPKQVFALPLSVGMVGENELCDITLTEDFSHEEVKTRLQKAFTNDIVIKEVTTPDIKMGKVRSAKYTLVFSKLPDNDEKIKEVLSNPPSVTKTTKSGSEKELDIKNLIYSFDVLSNETHTAIGLELACSGENYLSPDLVLVSLRNAGLSIPEDYDITRTSIHFESK